MSHSLQCRCGTVKGYVDNPERANRGVCYCKDCQAFAHFLGGSDILDEKGGTDVIQTLPENVRFTAGTEALACMRLRENGLLRWYARCCNTPIGNTPANFKISYVGLIHNCLESSGESLGESFGPVRLRVNTKSARGTPKPESVGFVPMVIRVLFTLLKARVDGSYRQTPFFANGTPVATPKVLSREELARVTNAL